MTYLKVLLLTVVLLLLSGMTSVAQAQTVPKINFYGKEVSLLKLFGQSDFTQSSRTQITNNTIYHGSGVVVDTTVRPNRIYAIDPGNNRVLAWKAAGFCATSKNDCTADSDCGSGEKCDVTGTRTPDIVFGQDSFTTGACNRDNNLGVKKNPTNRSLCLSAYPFGTNASEQWMRMTADVDAAGNFYLVDVHNDRVLKYNKPFADPSEGNGVGDTTADLVYGQPTMQDNGKNLATFYDDNEKPQARSLSVSVAMSKAHTASRGLDAQPDGGLWMADTYNNRVLHYPPNSNQPDIVLGQPDFTTNGCDLNNPAKLCMPTLVRVHPTTGDLYVVDETAQQPFYARIVIFKGPFQNGQARERVLTITQDGLFENWSGYEGGNKYYPQITGIMFGPNLQTGQSDSPQLIINGHADYRLMQVNQDSGVIEAVINALSTRRRGGDTEYQGRECGSIYEKHRTFFPGGGFGFDSDNNLYISDEVSHWISRYAIPYTYTQDPNGKPCLPMPAGGLLERGPNKQSDASIGEAVGLAVYKNQLIFLDTGRNLKAWNNYLDKPIGAAPDVVIRGGFSDRTRFSNGIDDTGKLWIRGEHDRIRVFQLPLNPTTQPVNDDLKVYWKDTGEQVNLQRFVTAAFNPAEKAMYLVDQGGARILRISNYKDLQSKVYVDLVIGQVSKDGTLCNQGKDLPGEMTICGVKQLSFDSLGNMFAVDNEYECHNNNRILAFSLTSLKEATTIFHPIKPTYYLGVTKNNEFGNCDYNQSGFSRSTISITFDPQGWMLLSNDGYYGIKDEREFNNLWLYRNPFHDAKPPGSFISLKDGIVSKITIPMGAPGDSTFDAQGNLILQDHTWPRIWVFNYLQDSVWLTQQLPTSSTMVEDVVPDRIINVFDYNKLLSEYNTVGAPGFTRADINKNGSVDIFDYSKLLEKFGQKL